MKNKINQKLTLLNCKFQFQMSQMFFSSQHWLSLGLSNQSNLLSRHITSTLVQHM